jgi:hypothetical protein
LSLAAKPVRCCGRLASSTYTKAVDRLQADAMRDGLVDKIGQDAVQAIMAKAFEAVR